MTNITIPRAKRPVWLEMRLKKSFWSSLLLSIRQSVCSKSHTSVSTLQRSTLTVWCSYLKGVVLSRILHCHCALTGTNNVFLIGSSSSTTSFLTANCKQIVSNYHQYLTAIFTHYLVHSSCILDCSTVKMTIYITHKTNTHHNINAWLKCDVIARSMSAS